MICTGLDLLSLDGSHAILCCDSSVAFKKVRRLLRIASWIYKARKEKGLCSALRAWSVLHNSQDAVLQHVVTPVVSPCKATRFTVVTSRGRLSKEVKAWLQRSNAQHKTISAKVVKRLGHQNKTGGQ